MLVQKGFRGPFRAWFQFLSAYLEKKQYTLDQTLIDSLENFENEDHANPSDENRTFKGIEESAKAIL